MSTHTLQSKPLNVNGTTRVKVIVKNDEGRTVDSEILTLESSSLREKLAQRLAKKYGWTIEDVMAKLLGYIDEADEQRGEDIGLKKRLADAIMKKHRFAQDAGGALHLYAGGTWRMTPTENAIKSAVLDHLHEWHLTKYWTPELAAAITEYISITAPKLWETPPTDKINVLNGIIDINTGRLSPHSPEFLSQIQIPIVFDPDARCDAWDDFIDQVLDPDAQHFPIEMFADLITPYRAQQKAFLLTGIGCNGKSVLLDAMAAGIGRENISTLSLQKLESDKFAVSRLVGKLANINCDLPATELKGSSVFKQIVGGDTLTGERKFCDSFDFRPYSRLIFSANHAPRCSDASEGFFRRWIVANFPNSFEGSGVSSDELHRRLTAPSELSGLLNRALQVIHQIRRDGFTISASMHAAANEFRALTDPVSVFLDATTIQGPNLHCSKRELYDAYALAAAKSGAAAIPIPSFGQSLKKARPNVAEAQITIAGVKKTWCWKGIGLRQGASTPNDGEEALKWL